MEIILNFQKYHALFQNLPMSMLKKRCKAQTNKLSYHKNMCYKDEDSVEC